MIKKLFTFFLCLVAMVMSANAQTVTSDAEQVMYIYQLDGNVHRFPIAGIDSIAFVHPTITAIEFETTDFFIKTDEILPIQQYLSLVPSYAYPAGVEWYSTNPSIVQVVKEHGTVCVKGIAEGTTNIIAKYGNLVATCQIIVSNLENGVYVFGEATACATLQDKAINKNAMSAGINEIYLQPREGMYEKYIALEGGKPFQIALKENDGDPIVYGATLAYGNELITTDYDNIAGYKGVLVKNASMQVNETGLYHIVIDFNKDGSLPNIGGPQVIIVPVVEWGVRGGINVWGFTAGTHSEFNKTTITYTWNVTSENANDFKFAYNHCWKINLDDAQQVKACTNFGCDTDGLLIPNGNNIPIGRGIYQIQLVWTLAGGELGDSFTYTITKTEDLPEIDPSTFIYSFIGSINGNWDTDTDFAFVSKNGNHYVFETKGLNFAAGEFKIRVDHDWIKSFGDNDMTIIGIETLDNNYGNISITNPFKGSARFEFDWVDGYREENITLTFIAE